MNTGGEGRTVFDAIGDAMRAIPGPTEAWADIVGHLAWPVTVVFLVLRFRAALGRAANLLAERFATDDVAGFGVSLKRPARVVPLAPGPPSFDRMSDADVTEAVLELLDRQADYDDLFAIVVRSMGDQADLDAFLTDPRYATDRRAALTELTRRRTSDG